MTGHITELADAGERGQLDIDRVVLRKLAEYAANRAGTGGRHASAWVSGPVGEPHIALDLAVRYPGSVRATVRAVEQRVVDEIFHATGLAVRSMRVTVSALVPEQALSRVE